MVRLRALLGAAVVALVLTAMGLASTLLGGPGNPLALADPQPRVTQCHHTGSESNPWVEIEINRNGRHGHGDHDGDLPTPCP